MKVGSFMRVSTVLKVLSGIKCKSNLIHVTRVRIKFFLQVPIADLMSNGTMVSSKLNIIQHLGVGCVVTPFVAFLETIAVAKTLSRKSNYKIDVTQELFSLGIVNVIGSFFSAFPVAGSFSRSALNSQCSVRTQLGGRHSILLTINN